LVVLTAGRENRCDGEDRHCTVTCDGSHAQNLVKFSQGGIVAAISTGIGGYDPISGAILQDETSPEFHRL
jgi:hypothetical protein